VPGDRDPIDFVGLAAALLDRGESLMKQWLPEGRLQQGRWYVGDFDGSAGKSANVNLKTGKWGDNGRPGDSGSDLISLYGRIHGLSNALAARELIKDQGWSRMPVQAPAKEKKPKKPGVQWMPIHPVPDDAPDYKTQWAHFSRGIPPMHWEYRDREGLLLGLVVRFQTSDGKKDVQPISFCQGSNGRREWRYRAFAEPRPLYGLWRLVETSKDQRALVIVVEGEKKADALYEALGRSTPVLGWPGGCKVVHMADWSVLADYRVLCWPDADAQVDKKTHELLPLVKQPGIAAMRDVSETLTALGVPVKIVDVGHPGEKPDGWDAGDAVEDGWTRQQLLDFMRNCYAIEAGADSPPAATAGGDGGGSTPPGAPQGDGEGPIRRDPHAWRNDLIMRNPFTVRECVPNVMLVLHNRLAWRGVLAFDEFSQRVVKRKPAPFDQPGTFSEEWTDVDDTRTSAWIAHHEDFVPNAGMVAEAANEVAHANPFHPVLEYLDSLEHDGEERLDHWLIDHLHVDDSPYTRLVSRYFLIGMCMRVLQPGCKFDYCLVLEGLQGRRKSSALRVLGGEWFSDIELDLANKDSMSNIRGKWLHEFGEMGSLARAESNRQKSFLSRQIDEFRPVYGRREIRCKRQSVFGGSTNEWAWNKDPTGGRRFWPVEVRGDIDTVRLAAIRDQLFAEAFALAKAHIADPEHQVGRYWPSGDEQRELFDPEQLARESPDAYVEILAAWLKHDPLMPAEFTLADACMNGLKLDAKSLTKDIQTRVGIALRKLDCERVERRTQVPRFVYKRPQRNAASSQTSHQREPEDGEVPF